MPKHIVNEFETYKQPQQPACELPVKFAKDLLVLSFADLRLISTAGERQPFRCPSPKFAIPNPVECEAAWSSIDVDEFYL